MYEAEKCTRYTHFFVSQGTKDAVKELIVLLEP